MDFVGQDILLEIFKYFTARQLSSLSRVSKQWRDLIQNIKEMKIFLATLNQNHKVARLISDLKNTFYEEKKVFPAFKDFKLLKMAPKQCYSESHFAITVPNDQIQSISFRDQLFYFGPTEFENGVLVFANIPHLISVMSKNGTEQLTFREGYGHFKIIKDFLVVNEEKNLLQLKIISIPTQQVFVPKTCINIGANIKKFETNGKLFICLPKLKTSGWYDFDSNQFYISKEYMVYCKEKDVYISVSQHVHIYDFKKQTKRALSFNNIFLPKEKCSFISQNLKVVDFIVVLKFCYYWQRQRSYFNTFGFLNLLDRNPIIQIIKFEHEMKMMDLNYFTNLALFMESRQKINPKILVYNIKTGNLVRNINLNTNEKIQYCKFNLEGILVITKTTCIQLLI